MKINGDFIGRNLVAILILKRTIGMILYYVLLNVYYVFILLFLSYLFGKQISLVS